MYAYRFVYVCSLNWDIVLGLTGGTQYSEDVCSIEEQAFFLTYFGLLVKWS